MRVIPGNAQAIGQRTEQQDAFGFSDVDNTDLTRRIGVLAVLADGMGGLAHGGEASRLAVRTFLAEYEATVLCGADLSEALDQSLRRADAAVVEFAEQRGEPGNVGCTLVALTIHEHHLHWRSVGDSRLYLWRRPGLTRLTEDHDYGRLLDQEVAAGRLDAGTAARDPARRALTSYVGQGPMNAVDGNRRPLWLASGDRLLICSDGLYTALDEPAIATRVAQALTPQEAAESLVESTLVCDLPGQDNVTVLVLECDDEPETLRRSPGHAAQERRRSWWAALLGLGRSRGKPA